MSLLSKWLGLDHPSNKPLLDVINSVGRALGKQVGIEGMDPGKIVLQGLLQKYAPQHLDPVMSAIGGLGVTAVEEAVTQAEGLPQPESPTEDPTEVSTEASVETPAETPAEVPAEEFHPVYPTHWDPTKTSTPEPAPEVTPEPTSEPAPAETPTVETPVRAPLFQR